MTLALDKMSLQVRLRITFTVRTCLNNGQFVISFIILTIHTNGTVECNELIGSSSCLELDDNWVIIRVVLEVGNTNHSSAPGSLLVKGQFMAIIPSYLPSLCGIPAHFPYIIGVQRISHLEVKETDEVVRISIRT